MKAERATWASDFGQASILVGESEVKRHHAYRAAKAGDARAAAQLVYELVTDRVVDGSRQLWGARSPVLASVHALEASGINAIPEALATRIAQRLGWAIEDALVQTNVVGHTGADGFSRLARQALFDGPVTQACQYLMVDDFIGQGGTLANFRGYIESRGGNAIGAVVLTGKPFSARIALSDQQLVALRSKHGELENWWRDRFGFGFDALTESEARYLVRTADAHTVRSRIFAAAQTHDGSGGEGPVRQVD